MILQNAYYSVISPEGCAAILWKDRKAAPQAAEALKITANQLLELGLVDEVIPEPLGGAHNDHAAAAATLREAITRALDTVAALPEDERLRARYDKFRRMGPYNEPSEA